LSNVSLPSAFAGAGLPSGARRELLHALVARMALEVPAERSQAAGEHLEAGARERGPQAAVERLVEVAHAFAARRRPTSGRRAARSRRASPREVVREQALERLLGGEHAALDREVDALQPPPFRNPPVSPRRAAGRRPRAGIAYQPPSGIAFAP
jgi:hypothetical protein